MRRHTWIVVVIWIALIGTSLAVNLRNARKEQETIAFQAGRSFFQQVLITRSWNAMHGGVYVPLTDKTPPNPYLEDPRREIVVDDALTLTKVNPAYMTRQIAEIASRKGEIRFHITSLGPIRPENRPTALEELLLKTFEKGGGEQGFFIDDKRGRQFFYMAPLKAESACLRCHGKQGYSTGDVIGGISVTLPFASKPPYMALLGGHIALGLFGLAGIVMTGRRLEAAYTSIRRQALMDPLTGIPNRRWFIRRIEEEIARCRREITSLSVILCDIDHFKLFNDTYGHSMGDDCLRQVAREINAALKRPGDFCARYGGEEFVLVLPNTDAEGALHLAEAIRWAILDLAIPHAHGVDYGVVSISLGATTATAEKGLNMDTLLKQSDEALYAAKNMGRNRVMVYGADSPDIS